MMINKRRKAGYNLSGGPWATHKDFSHGPTELDAAINTPGLSRLCVSIAAWVIPTPAGLAKRFDERFSAPPGTSWTPDFSAEVFIAAITRYARSSGLTRNNWMPRFMAIDADGHAYRWTPARWRAEISHG